MEPAATDPPLTDEMMVASLKGIETNLDVLVASFETLIAASDNGHGIDVGAAGTKTAHKLDQSHQAISMRLAQLQVLAKAMLSMQRMSCTIQPADGASFLIRLPLVASVKDAKQAIEAIRGHKPVQQLLFEEDHEEPMHDDYGLKQTSSTLFLVLKRPPVVIGSDFYSAIFTACGKIPNEPNLEQLTPLLKSPEFSGDADEYIDENGSTLLMYAAGPVTEDSMAVVQLLLRHGAKATHKNCKGETAMAYAKAWKLSSMQVAAGKARAAWSSRHDELILFLARSGCDPNEPPAFGADGGSDSD
jgi:hypothetical protein